MFKNFYISSLRNLKQFAVQSAVISLVYNAIFKFFVKPDAVIKDDRHTADMYNIGKKDNPKGVIITNKQFKTDFKPLVFFAVTAFIAGKLINGAKK